MQVENAATEEAAPPASTEVALPALETAAGSQKREMARGQNTADGCEILHQLVDGIFG